MAEAMMPAAPPIVTKPVPWHWWVTFDLFFATMGGGLFSVATILHLVGHPEEQAVARIAFLITFPIMAVDLVCLVFDLGDPWRFMNMMRVFKPGSPMSVGVWTISIFSVLAFCAFVIVGLGLPIVLLSIVGIAGLPFALMVGIYKGVLFSTTAQPGWRTMRWLGAFFSISAGLLGVAVALVIAAMSGLPAAATTLRQSLLIMIVLYFGTVLLLERDADEWTRVARRHSRFSVWLAALGGIVIPLLVITFSTGRLEEDCAAVLLIVGAIAIRHVLVFIPHRATAEN
ncbi:MAG TPA: NrfD/PsrC family molybdoenzyme membrane anchor subunit [Candidatus Binataceae bacterium]|nr:NrfD/PsrC family molybdoenzyme membrane anchor subunit [Candidatus Binataceae bacterium]